MIAATSINRKSFVCQKHISPVVCRKLEIKYCKCDLSSFNVDENPSNKLVPLLKIYDFVLTSSEMKFILYSRCDRNKS